MWLLECRKASISEHPSWAIVFTGIKYCWHDHGSTFIKTLYWSNTHSVGKSLCWWDLKSYDCLVTCWLPILCILVVRWKKSAQPAPLSLTQKPETFCIIFMAFSESEQNSVYFEKKNQLNRSYISEVSDSEKCGYLNARKLLFPNTLPESTCSRVLNTTDTTMEGLSSKLSIDWTHLELQKVSVSEIWNLRTVW